MCVCVCVCIPANDEYSHVAFLNYSKYFLFILFYETVQYLVRTGTLNESGNRQWHRGKINHDTVCGVWGEERLNQQLQSRSHNTALASDVMQIQDSVANKKEFFR